MKDKRQITIRLDTGIANAYEDMAKAKDIPLTTFIQNILTSNLYGVSLKHEVDRIKTTVDELPTNLKNILDKFSSKNSHIESFYDDFAFMQMMVLKMMQLNSIPIEEVKDMKKRGFEYSKSNYRSDVK